MVEVYLPEALEEFEAATLHYRTEDPDLARAFVASIQTCIDRVLANPMAGHSFGKRGLRRIIASRFPYSVVYSVTKDSLLIVAVAHQKRRPGFWARRR